LVLLSREWLSLSCCWPELEKGWGEYSILEKAFSENISSAIEGGMQIIQAAAARIEIFIFIFICCTN